jgi:hypothetical protein
MAHAELVNTRIRVSEVAARKVVAPAVDGPNLALVIRFEREGEERLARWLGGDDWIEPAVFDRLFAEPEPVAAAAVQPAPTPAPAVADDKKRREAPIALRLRWIQEIADMGPDPRALRAADLPAMDRASLVAVRRAIDARRREPARS